MQPITAAQPAAPRDGLAGAVGIGVIIPETDPLPNSDRWQGGYKLEGLACDAGYVTQHSCTDNGTAGRVTRRRWTQGPISRAFTIGASIECSTMGGQTDLSRWNAEARAELERVRWTRIGHELWTGGKAADHQHLASEEAEVLSLQPVSVVEAVAALEDAMGGCQTGQPDLIHVPRKATAYLANAGVVMDPVASSGRLFTHNGSLVIADRGYPGTGPEGQAPTASVVWAYATGIISARLGQITDRAREIEEAVDAETNDMRVAAEQAVAAGWLCCHYAIPIALSC